MSALEIIGGIFMIVLGIIIIALVLMQDSPKGSGVTALTGGDSYLNRNQGRDLDSVLSRFTKYAGIAFFLVTIIVYAFSVFNK